MQRKTWPARGHLPEVTVIRSKLNEVLLIGRTARKFGLRVMGPNRATNTRYEIQIECSSSYADFILQQVQKADKS